MQLTKIASYLRLARFENRELTKEEEELACSAGSDGFYYSLFDGGGVKPEQWFEGEDLVKMQNAIFLVKEFRDLFYEVAEEL